MREGRGNSWMVATWEREWQHSCRRNLVAKILQLWDPPHALLTVDDDPVILQDLTHVSYVLLVVPAADDYNIHAGKKSCVPLEGWPWDLKTSSCIQTGRRGLLWRFSKRPLGCQRYDDTLSVRCQSWRKPYSRPPWRRNPVCWAGGKLPILCYQVEQG